MTAELFTADFRPDCYWWDRTPRPAPETASLPAKADVVVIGSGYTGLHAALQTARAGRSTVVIDAEDLGFGCSTRNGGQVSTSVKPGFDALARRHGPERAFRIIKEGQNSLAFLKDFIVAEGIDCDLVRRGRFHAAHSAAEYESLAQTFANQPKGLETEAHMVARSGQRAEVGSDFYHGGVVQPQHVSVDPARYHQGLVDRVRQAGATLVARCPATAIEKTATGFTVTTPKGRIAARDVLVATNGYTGPLTPWLRRRVIPIGSYIIATEELPQATIDRLFPSGRHITDSRKVVYYYRASPDRRRILFGGRVSLSETDPRASGPKLLADMVRIFPELAGTRIARSWMGFVAYSFDELAHVGRHEGLWYAMGYCGSGVGMASYLGMRIGQQMVGLKEGATAFDGLTFQTRPFYAGNPWFLAPSILYYRWKDRLA
ncbi:FAD-binding oxidoreductase [Hyphomicrobiaceae bacterium 22]|uniref:FAD-binding oxidoreductase n=1 Tax=Prosthecodimorpha staleyi TaxID=2840188 RepID=A0A947GD53_9HYPH|nr:FAD-binding oxidoreductase [Prosthecodimorpha staleyi]